ncbi:cyclic nucleotide-binding domain-containing protein [Actinomadura madurae]|uniref:Crp/Fnr family transcriptional regulator n=1 Tax=Actinomadura madurae TaxID=1993 RepID=UPI0020D219E8|nr:cyclic nucleotide-binding domain-containing protein [Actinomadura madurae]MCP9967232.1 cyclic nucleotide-binding domain-containing protein [Actinomadura madurae]
MDVSERTWKLLVAAGAERRFGAGDVLLRQGDPATHVLLLAAGRVKALMTLPDGQVLLLAVRGPGELLAEIAALGGRVAPAGDAAPARGEAWRAEAAPPAGPRVVRALLRLAVPRGGEPLGVGLGRQEIGQAVGRGSGGAAAGRGAEPDRSLPPAPPGGACAGLLRACGGRGCGSGCE